jgi:2-(1,2-epoxy-1,2-dihydrophenyl)acetyl-CoA isomerase
MNLVNSVVEDDALMSEAEKMLQRISGVSPVSFGHTKQLLYESFHTSFETQLESERRALSACVASKDGKEGINAFLEKRKPEFNW